LQLKVAGALYRKSERNARLNLKKSVIFVIFLGIFEGMEEGEGLVEGGNIVHAVEIGTVLGCEQAHGDGGEG
jgi:hypothetical protein